MNHTSPAASSQNRRHTGSCHCGLVRFAVELAPDFQASCCNCSICMKLGVTSTIVKPQQFQLLSGEGNLSSYEWGARISKRHFCKGCGVLCYGAGYLEYVGGDYVSVNLNALDDFDVNELSPVHWDGRHDNWFAGPAAKPWPLKAPAV